MIDNVSSKKEAKEAFIAFALQQLGATTIDDFLSELKAQKKLGNRSDYSKLRTELNKMLVAKNGNNSELVKELETAIFNIAKYAQ
jgi:hypothetical protein